MNSILAFVQSDPGIWIIPGMLAAALLLVEIERIWTRSRRRAGRRAGLVARTLDVLAVLTCLVAAMAAGTRAWSMLASAWPGTIDPAIAYGAAFGAGAALVVALLLVTLRRRLAASGEHLATAVTAQPAAPAPAVPPTGSFLGLDAPAPPTSPRRQRGLAIGVGLTIVMASVMGGLAFTGQSQVLWADFTRWTATLRPIAATTRPTATAGPVATAGLAATALPAPTLPAPTESTLQSARVQGAALNLRQGAGTDQPTLAVLEAGTEVILLGETAVVESSEWIRVRAGELEGWVNRQYLDR